METHKTTVDMSNTLEGNGKCKKANCPCKKFDRKSSMEPLDCKCGHGNADHGAS